MGSPKTFTRDEPCPFDGYATGAYAALTVAGLNHHGTAISIMEWLREVYADMMNDPDLVARSSGSLTLSRDYDGEEFIGLSLSVGLGMVWAEHLPAGAAGRRG